MGTTTFSSLPDFLIHYLPRLTLAIFIQVFAFFFLKLYKNNLEDGKYFQNELTNISAKSSSLILAYVLKKDDNIASILKELSVTERNFKLGKEESLMILEKAKVDQNSDTSLIEGLRDVLNQAISTAKEKKDK